MMFADHRAELARTGHVEVLYVARGGRRYRASIAEVDGTHSLVLRPVPEAPPRLQDLDLPEQVAGFAALRGGFVAIAGFFGSERGSTLAALVDTMNRDPGRHLVTIEEPIEFLHPNGAALLHQREIGAHVDSAALGIRQAVATGVDTIVVGRIRDLDTLEASLTAVESGCLVLGGVDAGSVVGALSELTALAPLERRPRLRTRLARALRGCTAQHLLQRSHHAGRIAVVEVLVANPAVRAAIRLGNLHELPAIMERCRGLGMQTADAALRGLLARHLVTPEEAQPYSGDRDAAPKSHPAGASGR
jgi:twitching motility protein PilT